MAPPGSPRAPDDPLAPRAAGDEAPLAPAGAPPVGGAVTTTTAAPLAAADELPLAARLVVEIRTDGTRTVARGAVEDALQGQRLAVKVEGASPLELALALARALFEAPFLQRVARSGPSLLGSAARALLPGGRKPKAP